MEKRKWLWKRRSSEKSPGETESSESISSHSEGYSDDQKALKASPSHNTQSPEVTSKATVTSEEINDNIRSLREKLSAALVNVSAKEDLVKQHARVAEEAVSGWERAENETVILNQQLEEAVQKNLELQDRVSNLDGALKECVRQLRLAKEVQEQRIREAIVEKTSEWDSTKLELENKLLLLQTQAESAKVDSPAFVDPNLHLKLKFLEKQNSALKLELLSQSEELEIRTIERDLSTQAAETASKQHLESIKKVAKLEAEHRRLQVLARKSSTLQDQKSVSVSSTYVESVTDSQSDSGEQLNAVEIDSRKMSRLEPNECETSCSESWASALIAELDQFKKKKAINKNLTACSLEIDMMDDFLEMERLAALPEAKSNGHCLESETIGNQSANGESPLRADLDAMICRMTELEEKLQRTEAERTELEIALTASQSSLEASQVQLTQAKMRLEELQRELDVVNESKDLLEFQVIGMEVESRTMSAKVDSLNAEVEKEQAFSAELEVKYKKLEDELMKKTQEIELHQTATSNGELKINQEDLAVAAGKLAECQKTIASLGRQLKSLATLEDFLIDTRNLPEFSGGGSVSPRAGDELWKLHYNETFMPKSDSDPSKMPEENPCPSTNSNDGKSNACSSSTSPTLPLNYVTSAKSRNGFGKFSHS
ncbi:LOW QUALITY PROTEIN: filament-like plant protein [Cornus florida]|uniref:LOW QUALITY PROTEIN: filament-like plant protein n=1 Tax=Cornus florida TaxID=4283 RepID=UPI0028A1D46E|nr:LOW QUALITY PROTEIN: filament-like plant protein [Cornus florida]